MKCQFQTHLKSVFKWKEREREREREGKKQEWRERERNENGERGEREREREGGGGGDFEIHFTVEYCKREIEEVKTKWDFITWILQIKCKQETGNQLRLNGSGLNKKK